jgi:D-serine deaminase-like pyridoxal phosphate-dependent protein
VTVAISVLATVISRPRPDLAVIDAGLKAMSTDYGLPLVKNVEGAEIKALTDEEHERLVLSGPATDLPLGARVELVPTHGCTTIPLHSEYVVMKDGVAVDVVPIMCRGATY